MSNRISRNISIILRSERLIAQRQLAVLARQTSFVAMALIVGGIGLVMINVAAFFVLSEHMTTATSALVVAVANFALAGILMASANKADVGSEVQAVTEVRDMALEDLEAEARQAADEAKSAVNAVKSMASNPLGSFGPGIATGVAKAVVKAMKD